MIQLVTALFCGPQLEPTGRGRQVGFRLGAGHNNKLLTAQLVIAAEIVKKANFRRRGQACI